MPQIIEIDDLLDKTPWMIDETYPNFWAKPVLLKGKKNWNNNFVPAPLLMAQMFRDSEGEVWNPEESDHTTVVGPVPGPGQEVILPCKMKFSQAVVYVDDHPTTSYAFGFPANMWATVFRQMGMPGFVTTSWVAHQHMRRENLSHPKLFYGWTGAFTNLHNDFGDGTILICCLTGSKMVVMFPPTETVEEKLKAQRPEWVRRGNIIIPMEAPRDQNTKLLISSLGGCSVNLLPGEMVVIPPSWLHSVTCTEDKTLTLSLVILNEPVMDLVAMSFSRFPNWHVEVGTNVTLQNVLIAVARELLDLDLDDLKEMEILEGARTLQLCTKLLYLWNSCQFTLDWWKSNIPVNTWTMQCTRFLLGALGQWRDLR